MSPKIIDRPGHGAPHRAVYDGRERLGSIEKRINIWLAYDRRGATIGRFDDPADAIVSVTKAAARAVP